MLSLGDARQGAPTRTLTMKYAIFLLDGMADDPLPELGGKTGLDAWHT